jgi:transcriptional regulator with XRE-family HTH domain
MSMQPEPAIGLVIRRARERRRMTQQQLADAVGVSLRSVSNWELGHHVPRNRTAVLEEVLAVSLRDDKAQDELVPENDWERDVLGDADLPPDVRRALVLDWRRGRDEAWAAARRQASAPKAGQAEAG